MNTTNVSMVAASACRWTGRILGALVVLLVLVIAIGEGIPNPFTQPIAVQIGFLGLALILGGILAGWRWEYAGAIISMAGWCVFVLVAVMPMGKLNWFVITLAFPGILYMTSALLTRLGKNQPAA